MELVVDTNVIFSAILADGKTRELIITEELDLSVPQFFFEEMRNNSEILEEKSELERNELRLLLELLFDEIQVIPRKAFQNQLPSARTLIGDVDPDDVPFLALALHLDVGIWSDDEHFRTQQIVDIWQTQLLIESLE